MSAFILDNDHIDYLVTAALMLRGRRSISWRVLDGRPEAVDLDNATDVGRMLLAENLASVNYRYNESDGDELVNAYRFKAYIEPMVDNARRVPLVLKAIECYEYQSCEHPGWRESPARLFCQRLHSAYIRMLPGYDNAPWEVRRSYSASTH